MPTTTLVPPNWRYAWNNSAAPLVVRAHALTAAAARPSVTVSRPTGGPDGGSPTLAYGGLAHGLTHVLPFLEQRRGAGAQHSRRRTTWAELADGRAATGADLLAVGLLRRAAPRTAPRHCLLLPFRISLSVPVGPDPQEVVQRLSRKARQQHARELRSRDRTLEVATSEADFHSFYDGMHRPTMRNRHRDAARSEERRSALVCLFRRGVLFFLRESGRRVAGMLCRLEGATLVVRLAGVEAGGEEPYRSGTYMAMYVLILQWAAEHGLTRVDLSGCEPFLSKGIFQFKRKMHPEVTLPDNHFRDKRLMLRVLRDTPEVRDLLTANPVLAYDTTGGALEAVYFHDADRPARTDLRWQCPGVSGQRAVDLDEFLDGLPRSTPRTPAAQPARP
ncbi:GNAT family N-acetyltransferase [Streptomyces sp. NBC_00239]|uniref:GNAT family N-acetyltransferase n=1 Tax=Streptomyces sp. NBC_00239 TaxID=2903640 RepID=UPI002E28C43D|nr:GNAT family N-acetyltransferase [Streptomyces sp. NBC_00239]